MQLTSPVFSHTDFIPQAYTCDGANLHPPLTIVGVIPGAKSLVLIVDDPDAPGGLWTHWLLWNLDPQTTEISATATPVGSIQGLNDFGDEGYGGPCPPSGIHHYRFTLYALSKIFERELTPLAKRADVDREITGHILDQAQLIGLYQRIL
ncbi:hypothetical protein A2W24_02990 [Microgenomates group bacterium RBG_16_45_19]|nr:MAG: hypothetical protein A2W24_02990 [Microgenomates group bacterium RBG_16_45_19]